MNRNEKRAAHAREEEKKGNKVVVIMGIIAVLLAIGIIAVASLLG